MGQILLPSRFNQQPQQVAQFDRSNPLVSGIAGAWYPQNNAARKTNGATTALTSVGQGYATTITAYWQASPTAVISLSPTWTILAMVYGAQAGVGNGFPLYCERPNATQLLKLQIGLGATSTANMVVRDSGGVGLVNISGTSDVRTMTGTRTIVGTRRALADHRLFVNGVQDGSSTVNPGSSFADTSAILGYDLQDTGAALTTALLPVVIVWTRSLSDAEIAEISRNPWQVFKSPQRRLWSVPAAAGTTDGSLSASEGSDTATGSGSVASTSVSGTLAASEGIDTLASSGAVAASTVTGTFARSEGADAATATGTTAFATITGTATVSEASDTAQASGAIGNAAMGTLARQEGSDTLTSAGAVAYPTITASLARQEAADSLVATGSLLFAITGMMAVIELPDTLQASSPAPAAPKLNLYTTMRDSPVNVSTPLGAPVNLAGTMLPSVINLYTTMLIPAVNMTANLGAPVNITGNLL